MRTYIHNGASANCCRLCLRRCNIKVVRNAPGTLIMELAAPRVSGSNDGHSLSDALQRPSSWIRRQSIDLGEGGSISERNQAAASKAK